MQSVTPLSGQIWDQKYRFKDPREGQGDRSLSGSWRRVARAGGHPGGAPAARCWRQRDARPPRATGWRGQTGSRWRQRRLGGGLRRAELARRGAAWGRGASREHGRAGASHSVEPGLVPKTCNLVTGAVSGLNASMILASKQLTAGGRATASATGGSCASST